MKSNFFRLCIFSLLMFLSLGSYAQQYPLFTNYLTNNIGFNPAVVAVDEAMNVRLIYRQQWVGLSGGPQSAIGAAYGKLRNKPIGLGGYAFQDIAGDLRRTGGTAILGATQQLGEQTFLGAGFSAGYFQTRLSDSYRAANPTDPLFAAAQVGQSYPDFNAGLLLRSGGLQLGLSVPQVFQRQLNFGIPELSKTELKRHYYSYASYKLPLSDKISLEPGAMLKFFPDRPMQWDAMMRLNFNKSFWLGGNYRNQDAVAVVAGLEMKGLMLYYGYDISTSKLRSFQSGSHELTLAFRFGAVKDKDNDGVADKEDKCPEVAGVKDNDGCPANDRDQDGIADEKDKCPDVKGTKENEGCPKDDRDQDGIVDAEDKCPDEKGETKLQGCPDKNKDTDGDGVPDIEDQCPTQAGLKLSAGCPFGDADNDGLRDDIDRCPLVSGKIENMGCPLGDRDQDGILDSVDPCPDEAGTVANSGCPAGKGPNALMNRDRDGDGFADGVDKCPNTPGVKEKEGCPIILPEGLDIITVAIKNVYFDFDKAEIKPMSYAFLDKLVGWMVKHPEYDLYMAGHTDSRGEDEYNMQLSKNRVFAVKRYLESKGIQADRVRVEWFGEKKPIASNMNEAGRQQNRRVEMTFEFD